MRQSQFFELTIDDNTD